MSPTKPKPPCPICRRLNCTRHQQERRPFEGSGPRKVQRPDYSTSRQTARRRAVVQSFIDEHGFPLSDGTIGARCPDCGMVRTKWVADHVVAIADGGSEDGPLRVHCRVCSGKQGAQIVNDRQK